MRFKSSLTGDVSRIKQPEKAVDAKSIAEETLVHYNANRYGDSRSSDWESQKR